jgi:hypothetical protein
MTADVFLGAMLALVALLLAIVTLLSYARAKHPRLLWVAVAFGILFVKGVWTVLGLLLPHRFGAPALTATLVLDLGMVALLYLALLQRTRG